MIVQYGKIISKNDYKINNNLIDSDFSCIVSIVIVMFDGFELDVPLREQLKENSKSTNFFDLNVIYNDYNDSMIFCCCNNMLGKVSNELSFR